MRFILGYVSCCLMSTPCTDHEPSSQVSCCLMRTPCTVHEPSSQVTPATEETRSLVAVPTVNWRRKRATMRGSSADWRPSLFVISEDTAVAVAATAANKAENSSQQRRTQPVAPRNVKRCGQSSVRANAHSRSSYEYSREPLQMVVPAFSAAPFMF